MALIGAYHGLTIRVSRGLPTSGICTGAVYRELSLARDKKLVDHGWKVSSLTVLDIFPQTYHVETVAYLTR